MPERWHYTLRCRLGTVGTQPNTRNSAHRQAHPTQHPSQSSPWRSQAMPLIHAPPDDDLQRWSGPGRDQVGTSDSNNEDQYNDPDSRTGPLWITRLGISPDQSHVEEVGSKISFSWQLHKVLNPSCTTQIMTRGLRTRDREKHNKG